MNSRITIQTRDGLKISATYWSKSGRATQSCLVVGPGFASHSQLQEMLLVCGGLAQTMDVLCIDFRGNFESEGGYSFGGNEYIDLLSAMDWAKETHSKIYLMGFSLGAYSALRAATQYEAKIEHLFLISCPTKVDDIFWSGAALHQGFDQMFVKRNFKRSRHIFFRWRNPFCKKPSALEFAPTLKIPVSFLSGDRDRLVPMRMSKRVYEVTGSPDKLWLDIPSESHADELFIADQDRAIHWFKSALARGERSNS